MEKQKILIVDDSEMNRSLLADILEEQYDVVEAENGVEAVSYTHLDVYKRQLKHSGREEQAFLTSLAGLVLVLFWMIPYIYQLFETMKELFAL